MTTLPPTGRRSSTGPAMPADPTGEALVRDYLGRLQSAAILSALPADRREELLAEVSDHITDALGSLPASEQDLGAPREAAVRNVLERLGAPEDIVRAEVESDVTPGGQSTWTPPMGGRPVGYPVQVGPTGFQRARDPLALFLLLFGGFFFLIGWLVGGGLLWASPSWRLREKLLGVLVWPFGYVGVGFLATMSARTELTSCTSTARATAADDVVRHCTTSGGGGLPAWAGVLLGIFVLIAPLVMASWLWRKRVIVPEEQPAPQVPYPR